MRVSSLIETGWLIRLLVYIAVSPSPVNYNHKKPHRFILRGFRRTFLFLNLSIQHHDLPQPATATKHLSPPLTQRTQLAWPPTRSPNKTNKTLQRPSRTRRPSKTRRPNKTNSRTNKTPTPRKSGGQPPPTTECQGQTPLTSELGLTGRRPLHLGLGLPIGQAFLTPPPIQYP